jgi:hypothetical protein
MTNHYKRLIVAARAADKDFGGDLSSLTPEPPSYRGKASVSQRQ